MTTLDILFSFLLTWSVGLGLPCIVRFVLYRRSLEKNEALTWTFVLGFIELVFFIWSGSQSKTHAVLVLIGLVSYRLLQTKSGSLDKSKKPIEQASSDLLVHTEHKPRVRLNLRSLMDSIGFPLHLGWIRLFTVIAICWVATLGGRLVYELAGQSSEMFLVDKTTYPPDFVDGQFEHYELELRKQLKNVNSASTMTTEISEPLSFYDQLVKQDQENISKLLKSFDLPKLTTESTALLASELAISDEKIQSLEPVARQYLQVRELKLAMQESPVLRAQVMGFKSPS